MTYQELYQELLNPKSDLVYPFNYDNESKDYFDYWSDLVEKYKKKIHSLSDESVKTLNKAFEKALVGYEEYMPAKKHDFKANFDEICETIKEALNLCYRNYYEDAYKLLFEFFTRHDDFYLKMLPRIIVEKNVFYRIRPNFKPSKGKEQDGDLFHLPFHLRHKAASTRYGFLGYPVFYLAGSLQTAWYEMNCPDIKSFSYAKFRPKNTLSFLDLGYPIYKKLEDWEYYSFLVFYPLIMGCLISVKHPDDPFKPEYMLPQFMTKIIRERPQKGSPEFGNPLTYKGFAGIVYMSTKSPHKDNLEDLSLRNFALFPQNTICRGGHDNIYLSPMFEMTDIKTFSCCIKSFLKGGSLKLIEKNDKLLPTDVFHPINVTLKK
ncbi:MAG: RES domain-containing protein [Prevotella sp.]|nr:RES domain-containing protein [Prevotella sp.]